MARRPFMDRTQLRVWSTSSWSTNSVAWRLGALTEIQTWERPMKWASGRHGSKPAPETTKLILWSLPTSSNALMAFSVATVTFLLMEISPSSADLMLAAATSLAAWHHDA